MTIFALIENGFLFHKNSGSQTKDGSNGEVVRKDGNQGGGGGSGGGGGGSPGGVVSMDDGEADAPIKIDPDDDDDSDNEDAVSVDLRKELFHFFFSCVVSYLSFFSDAFIYVPFVKLYFIYHCNYHKIVSCNRGVVPAFCLLQSIICRSLYLGELPLYSCLVIIFSL